MNALLNCAEKLKVIINANKQMIDFYDTILDKNGLESIDPSINFLKAQKKRFKNASKFELNRLTQENPKLNTQVSSIHLTLLDNLIPNKTVDSYLLKLIDVEQNFNKFYLEIVSKLNPEGAVYQRLVNHIDEMRMSLTMLEKNIMHQQKLMTA